MGLTLDPRELLGSAILRPFHTAHRCVSHQKSRFCDFSHRRNRVDRSHKSPSDRRHRRVPGSSGPGTRDPGPGRPVPQKARTRSRPRLAKRPSVAQEGTTFIFANISGGGPFLRRSETTQRIRDGSMTGDIVPVGRGARPSAHSLPHPTQEQKRPSRPAPCY